MRSFVLGKSQQLLVGMHCRLRVLKAVRKLLGQAKTVYPELLPIPMFEPLPESLPELHETALLLKFCSMHGLACESVTATVTNK